MRFLPALLLITTPLLAQEPWKPEAAEARRKHYEEVQRLLEQLRTRSDGTRERAMEALKQANLSIDELVPLIARAMEKVEGARRDLADIQVARSAMLSLGSVGTEAISGSADGTSWTLKALGDGKYDLHATKHAEDGRLMEEWKDKGTLKELQEKYAFLRSGLAIQVPAPELKLRTALGRPLAVQYAQPWGAGGALVDSWGGGGMVGVTVTEPSEDLRFHLELPEGAGFLVQQVIPGSRAEAIGIRRMDILLRLDGELIDSPIQLKKLHEKTGVLEIIRRSETKRIDLATVAAEEKPAAEGKAAETAPDGAR